jgi:HEAT repeat protein
MNTNLLKPLLLAGLVALNVSSVRAETEQELIGILRSQAGAVDKCEACKKLRLAGTKDSVPALAAMLNEERVSQAARYALERLPCPEAGAALRESASRTSGLLKAGLIDSLGWRREASDVQLLKPLLADPDPGIASAAATALGRIASNDALTALKAARESAAPAVRPAVLEALMRCAEGLLADGKGAGARAIYEWLAGSSEPDPIRVAACAGLLRCAGSSELTQIKIALQGQDPAAQVAALQLAGGLQDPKTTGVLAGLLQKSQPAMQVALLTLLRTRGDAAALPAVQAAVLSQDAAVRTAAFAALGELGDVSAISTLANAATSSDATEQKAARQALATLRRGDVAGVLVAQFSTASPAVQVELARALTARDEKSAVPALLQLARSDRPAVRKAALQALNNLADGSHVGALVQLLTDAKGDDARGQVVSVFESLAERLPEGRGMDVEPIVRGLAGGNPETRKALAQVCALFVNEPLRIAFRSALNDSDEGVRAAAARGLCNARDVALLADLLAMARQTSDSGLRSLGIEGLVRKATDEANGLSVTLRTETLASAFELASRLEDKRQVLSGLARVPNRTTLELARKASSDPAVKAEAGVALLQITQKLGFSGPFIQDWQICGPYRKAGIAGALAVFNIPFGPETPGEKVEWRPAPRAEQVNLAALFPGEENCAAYLKVEVIAPEASDGFLLLGSDDGVKAWLNGKLVHANNVDRGDVADQDKVAIRLEKGTNELLLKITQGGGGWSAHARIVGADGQPIPGLRVAP